MNHNYSELLAFDRASSIVRTGNESSRKLAAWANRLTETDYPATWVIDFLDGTSETLSLNATSPHIWSSDNAALTITFADSEPSSFTLVVGTYSFSASSVSEGFLTLDGATDGQLRVNLCDPSTRKGEKSARVIFNDISRSAASDELDEYCYSRFGSITDQEIKGHTLDGTWRLSSILKDDSDSKNTIQVSLVYKEGYAQTLNFDEATILNKQDFRTDSTNLVIKFDNIDPRYAETAKDAHRSQTVLSSPVFAGVPYDGYWNNIKMVTSETNSQGGLEDAVSVIWFLSQHNNTDLYYRYYAAPNIVKGHLFKWDTTEALIADLLKNHGFSDDGHQIIYTSTSSDSSEAGLQAKLYWYDSGTTLHSQPVFYETTGVYCIYSADDNESWILAKLSDLGKDINFTYGALEHSATSEGPVGTFDDLIRETWTGSVALAIATVGVNTLQEPVAGRTVEYRRTSRDEEDRLFDFEVEITWTSDTQFSGSTAITINNGRVETVTEQGWRATEAQLETKRTEYAALSAGQTGRLDFKERSDGLYDYVGQIITTTFGSDCVQTADATTYTGHHIDPASGTPCKKSDGTFVSWSDFKTVLGSEMGNARIEWNDDNTISYTVQTTGDLDHSDWTYYKGSEVTERVYIRRNQTAAEIDSFITSLALEATAGQQVDIERVKDDAERMSVTVRITTLAAKTVDFAVGGSRVSTVTQMGWGVSPDTADALDDEYSSLPDGTTGKIDLRKNQNGTFDYIGVKTTSTSDSEYIVLADQTVYYGYHIDPAETALVCAYPGGDKTWSAFKEALGSQMGNARIEWNEDGTLNYSVTTSGDLVDSTWVYRVGDTITETVYILRNTTDDAIDAKITEVDDGTAGTVVTVERIKDDQERLSATIRKRVEGGKADGNIVLSGTRQSVTTSQGWGVTEGSADAAKLSGATGTSVTFEKRRREDGLYDYRAVSVATTADSDVIKLADQTVYVGYHINAASGETCRDSDGELVTWAALKAALGSEMGNARIEWNDDNTISYTVQTTGDLDDSDWTYYKGDTLTERVIVRRNKTDAEIDAYLAGLYSITVAGATDPDANGVYEYLTDMSEMGLPTTLDRNYFWKNENGYHISMRGDKWRIDGTLIGQLSFDINNAGELPPKTGWLAAGSGASSDISLSYGALPCSGTQYSIERVKDDNKKMSVTIRITTESGKSDFGNRTVAGGRISTVTEQGWGIAEDSVPSDYDALGTGVTGKLDVRRREDGLFDYVGIQTTITGDSEYVELVGATIFVGDHIDPEDGTPCSTPDTAGGANKSWADFKTYIADMGGRAQITLNEDGTVSYVCNLTDSDNASMYIRTVRGDGSVLGTYTLYGSKTECETVADTLQFDADGELVTFGGSTLDAKVAGRTVSKPQISYDKDEGLYRFEVSIQWASEQSEELANHGNYIVGRSVSIYTSASSLPEDGTLDPTYAADGSSRTDYALTGPSGGGMPVLNDDGTYDYAVVATIVTCKDTSWHVGTLGAIKPETKMSRSSFSAQQIRQRLGGELAYEEDSRGNLVGIDWNLDWDAGTNANGGTYPTDTAPDNWVTSGYQARYGDWQSHWTKGYLMGAGSLLLDDGTNRICKGPFQEGTRYFLGDVIWRGADATAWSATGYFAGDVVTYNGKYYTANEATASTDIPGASSKWTDGAFAVLSSATAWSATSLAPAVVSSTPTPSSGEYEVGNVRQSGNKIYTCKGEGYYVYKTAPGSGGSTLAYYANNSTHPPESELGKMFWEEGVVSASTLATTGQSSLNISTDDPLTWGNFDDDLVKAKIAQSGVGEAPFEQPDLHVPIKQELQREVLWNENWEWKSDVTYPFGSIILYLTDGKFYQNQDGSAASSTGNTPTGIPWVEVTGKNPTSWGGFDAWQSGTTYNHSNIVSYQGKIYASEDDSNTDAPTETTWSEVCSDNSSAYANKYGDWQAAWTKGFRTGAGSILSTAETGKICRGAFDNDMVLRVGDVVSTAESISSPAFKVVTGAVTAWSETAVNPIDLGLASPTYPSGDYAEGAIVESGGEVYTCRGTGCISYASSDGYDYVANNSTHPPGSALGQQFWERGAKELATPSSSTTLTWADFDADLVKASISTSGSGVEPFEAVRTLGVLDEDGFRSLSASARHAFYNNIAANPRWVEVWECLIRYFQSVEMRTYFAVNPHWLSAANRRIPTTANTRAAGTYTDREQIAADIDAIVGDVLHIDINSLVSNVEVNYTFEPLGDLWVGRAMITVRSTWEPDTEELAAMVGNLESPNVGVVSGALAFLAYDFTGALELPWGDDKFLDVS